MNTYLGACRDFCEQDLDLETLVDSRILHLTGYLWDTDNQRKAAETAAETARRKGLTISFDLADLFAVTRYRKAFLDFVPEFVDVLFGNRDELALLTETNCDEDCVAVAAPLAATVVMKVGERGCYLCQDNKALHVAGRKVAAVDTTGAGDAFAGGYLFALLSGKEPVGCAETANALAAGIVGVEGCDYQALSASKG